MIQVLQTTRNQFVDYRPKMRPVVEVTRKKNAQREVTKLVRKGYLKRGTRPTGEQEVCNTVTIDTQRIVVAVLTTLNEFRHRYYQLGDPELVALVNPRYLRLQFDTLEPWLVEDRYLNGTTRELYGVQIFLWSGIDTIILIPKSVFQLKNESHTHRSHATPCFPSERQPLAHP